MVAVHALVVVVDVFTPSLRLTELQCSLPARPYRTGHSAVKATLAEPLLLYTAQLRAEKLEILDSSCSSSETACCNFAMKCDISRLKW